jgi:hypothetical protein
MRTNLLAASSGLRREKEYDKTNRFFVEVSQEKSETKKVLMKVFRTTTCYGVLLYLRTTGLIMPKFTPHRGGPNSVRALMKKAAVFGNDGF